MCIMTKQNKIIKWKYYIVRVATIIDNSFKHARKKKFKNVNVVVKRIGQINVNVVAKRIGQIKRSQTNKKNKEFKRL